MNIEMSQFEEYRKSFLELKGDYRFSRLGKVFCTTNNKYFYDTGTGKIFSLDNDLYNILNCFSATDDFEKIFDLGISNNNLLIALEKISKTILDEKILNAPPVKTMTCNELVTKKLEDLQLRHICLEMTERCNLRCKYCIYQEGNGAFREFGQRDMTFDIAKKAIDLLSLSEEEEVFVSFYGGEPLLKFELIKQCIDYCKEKLSNKKVNYNMTTNCTLITKEIATYLASIENYFTTVSIDGPEKIHDKNRIFVNGSGSFKKAINGLKLLIAAEGEHASRRVKLNMVLDDTDTETLDTLQSFINNSDILPKEMDISTSYISIGDTNSKYLGVDTDEDRKIVYNDVDPLLDWNIDKIRTNPKSLNNNNLISKDSINKELFYIHKRLLIDEPIKSYFMNGCCIPGARRLYVTVDGNFAMCERIGPAPFIGNVNDGLDFKAIKKHYFDDFIKEASKFCNDCWAVTLCSLCYLNCYNEDGINMPYRHRHCLVNRRILEKDLISYHEILENNPESLEYLNEIIFS